MPSGFVGANLTKVAKEQLINLERYGYPTNPYFWVEERFLSGSATDTQRTVNTFALKVTDRHNGSLRHIIPTYDGGAIRTGKYINHLERNTIVTIHNPITRNTALRRVSGLHGIAGDYALDPNLGIGVGLIGVSRWQLGSGYRFDAANRVHTYRVSMFRERVALSFGQTRNRREGFMSMVNAHNPIAMINAGFFGRDLANISENIGFAYNRDNEVLHHTIIDPNYDDVSRINFPNFRVLFYYDDGRPSIIKNYRDLTHNEVVNMTADKGLLFIISGTSHVHPTAAVPRSAIGITQNGEIILLAAESMTNPNVERTLQGMGAVNTLILDGGGSTNFYYNGELRVRGDGRLIGSVLQVHEK